MSRDPSSLSRRERQIMQIIYRLGRATASEVRENLPEPPSYSAVRALLRVLEEKGHLRHQQDGPRYVYSPTVSLQKARRSALRGKRRRTWRATVPDDLTPLPVPFADPGEAVAAEVTLDGAAVNVRLTVEVPSNRWLLWAGGPDWGPVVTMWEYVFILALAAWALGRLAPTPLAGPL